MKCASVYVRSKTLIIYSSSRTTDGVWVGQAPYVQLETSATVEEKGLAVLAALERSEEGIPHPSSWEGSMEKLLRAGGVKSWRQFVKSARAVSVESRDAQVVMIPMENLGPTNGFEDLHDLALTVPAPASATEVGETLDRAIELAK